MHAQTGDEVVAGSHLTSLRPSQPVQVICDSPGLCWAPAEGVTLETEQGHPPEVGSLEGGTETVPCHLWWGWFCPWGGRRWGVCAWPRSASRSCRHLPSEFLDLQTHHAASAFTITSPSPWVQRCPNAPLHKDSGHTGQGPPSNTRTLRARGSIPTGYELVAPGGGSALVSPTGRIAAAGPRPST